MKGRIFLMQFNLKMINGNRDHIHGQTEGFLLFQLLGLRRRDYGSSAIAGKKVQLLALILVCFFFSAGALPVPRGSRKVQDYQENLDHELSIKTAVLGSPSRSTRLTPTGSRANVEEQRVQNVEESLLKARVWAPEVSSNTVRGTNDNAMDLAHAGGTRPTTPSQYHSGIIKEVNFDTEESLKMLVKMPLPKSISITLEEMYREPPRFARNIEEPSEEESLKTSVLATRGTRSSSKDSIQRGSTTSLDTAPEDSNFAFTQDTNFGIQEPSKMAVLASPSRGNTWKSESLENENREPVEKELLKTRVSDSSTSSSKSRRSLLSVVYENPSTWQPPVVDFAERYRGGRVLAHPINIYLIWYGQWDEISQKAVIRAAINSLTPAVDPDYSPSLASWWKIATQYSQWPPWGAHVSNNVTIKAECSDAYSVGKSFDLSSNYTVIEQIIARAVNFPVNTTQNNNTNTAPFPYDPTGIVMLMLGADVKVSTGAAAKRLPFCAFHTFLCLDPDGDGDGLSTADCTFGSNNKVVYTFAPFFSTANFFDNCNLFDPNGSNGAFWPPPNGGDGALDSMVSAVLHELVEAATNPFGNAWAYNRTENSEVADLCSYVFGPGGYYYCAMPDPYGPFYSSVDSDGINGGGGHTCSSSGTPLRDTQTNVVYNIYGAHGMQFLVQYLWSLQSAGCQLQYEEMCKNNVQADQMKSGAGVISVGYFADAHGSNGGAAASTTGPMVGMQRYAAGLNCSWAITVPNAKSLSFTFSGVNTATTSDFLKLYSGTDSHLQTAIAGSISSPNPQIIPGSSAIVDFATDGSRSPAPGSTGWQLMYIPGYCAGVVVLADESGNITDGTPSGQSYASGLNCSWIIKPSLSAAAAASSSGGNSTTLAFTRIDIGPADWIAVYDGENAIDSTKQLRHISGVSQYTVQSMSNSTFFSPLYTVTSQNNEPLFVNFVTLSSKGQGWAAVYGPTHSILAQTAFSPLPSGSSKRTPSFLSKSPFSLTLLTCILVQYFIVTLWTL